MRVQRARASPESPRIQTVIRADPRKADDVLVILIRSIIYFTLFNIISNKLIVEVRRAP
jgi:hypothetical protein